MRYIGGKSLLISNIINTVKYYVGDNAKVIDAFAGSGIVSLKLKESGYKVISNDIMYFPYVMIKGFLENNTEPYFNKISRSGLYEVLNFLNTADVYSTGFTDDDFFVYNNYSPTNSCERMFFQNKNAKRIDFIRLMIDKWYKERLINIQEYFYLLSALLQAVPYISNITGTYASYLKFWDKRTYNDLTLKNLPLINSIYQSKVYNLPCNDLLLRESADMLYMDAPYDEKQYPSRYHVLETIAKYDNPEIHGKSGIREWQSARSDFCSKKTVENAFKTAISLANVKFVVISYSSEGLVSIENLIDICEKFAYGEVRCEKIKYRRYKNLNKSKNSKDLFEYISSFKKS